MNAKTNKLSFSAEERRCFEMLLDESYKILKYKKDSFNALSKLNKNLNEEKKIGIHLKLVNNQIDLNKKIRANPNVVFDFKEGTKLVIAQGFTLTRANLGDYKKFKTPVFDKIQAAIDLLVAGK